MKNYFRIELNHGFYISDILSSDKAAYLESFKEKQITDQMLNIPHPYTDADAQGWIAQVAEEAKQQGRSLNWAIRDISGNLVGGIGFRGLDLGKSHKGELGYWLAKEFWNRGIMTEAVRLIVKFGFSELGLSRITAHIFSFNIGSEKVLLKSGFKLEGFLRKHYQKNGKLFDGKTYGILTETPEDFLIRESDKSDADTIKSLMTEFWGGEPLLVRGKNFFPSELPGFIALKGAKIAGFLFYIIEGSEAEVIVFEAFEKFHGLGTKLLNKLKNKARSLGIKRVHLTTHNDNLDALRFYQTRGFRLYEVHFNSMEQARRTKPSIPEYGDYAIPIRDEIDLELYISTEKP